MKANAVMMKFLLLILISAISCAQPMKAGNWKTYPVFNGNMTRITDTGDYVYTVTDGSLFRYNKESQLSECLNKDGMMSDNDVKNIYYDKTNKNLVVAYSNSNIDIITANDAVVNVSGIKNMAVHNTKTINDVSFGKSVFYVATDFGYLTIDNQSFKVTGFHHFDTKLVSVAEVGNRIVFNDGSKIYYGEKGKKYRNLAALTPTSASGNGTLLPIDDSSFLFNTASALYKVTISDDGTFSPSAVIGSKVQDVQPVNSGFIAVMGASLSTTNAIARLDAAGLKTSQTSLPQDIVGSLLHGNASDGTLWTLNSKGIQNVKIDVNGEAQYLTSVTRPNGRASKQTYYLDYHSKSKKLLAVQASDSPYFSKTGTPSSVSTFDGYTWEDITPAYAPTTSQRNNKLNDAAGPVYDPEDPSIYYVGTWFDGVYKVKDNVVVNNFNWTNSPLDHALNGYFCNVSCMAFDRDNNLWLVQSSTGEKSFLVLPRDKQGLEMPSASDWIVPAAGNTQINRGLRLLITKKDNIKVYSSYIYMGPISFIDDGGNPASATIKRKDYCTFLDEEGKLFNWLYPQTVAEDADGRVWAGFYTGIVSFDPKDAFNDDFRVSRKRNKANPGEYLLDNARVSCIAVDGSNRKWIGSSNDGLYILNAEGDEILYHFTDKNSPLENCIIYSLKWMDNIQAMMISTPSGLYSYSPDENSSSGTYLNASVTPSLVEPEYKGLVEISSLVDSSILTVTDKNGNIVKTITSKGGKAAWDCRNEQGQKVSTGVYTVTAQPADKTIAATIIGKIYVVE